MASFKESVAKGLAFFRRRELDRDFDQELDAHLTAALDTLLAENASLTRALLGLERSGGHPDS